MNPEDLESDNDSGEELVRKILYSLLIQKPQFRSYANPRSRFYIAEKADRMDKVFREWGGPLKRRA